MTASITVRDNAESRAYEALIGDEVVGTLVYEHEGKRIVFSHTFVEPRHRGQGVGAELVKQAMEDLRSKGTKVTVLCDFAADFVAKHPEYVDVIDVDHPGLAHLD
jgi:hypothetical protein